MTKDNHYKQYDVVFMFRHSVSGDDFNQDLKKENKDKFFSPHVGHIYDAEQETKLQSVDWLNWAPESELAPVC